MQARSEDTGAILQRCVYELLEHGADDWVDAAEVASIAKFTGGANTEDDIRDLSLQVIREVVKEGLMEIGDLLSEDGGFRRWELSDHEAVDRVIREWMALGRNPTLSDLCWLNNTSRGNEIGNALTDLWNEPRELTDTLLMKSALYGVVDLPTVSWLVEVVGGAERKARTKAAILLIDELTQQGLMDVVQPKGANSVIWSLPLKKHLKEITRGLDELGTARCCLQATAEGQRRGEKLLSEKSMPPPWRRPTS